MASVSGLDQNNTVAGALGNATAVLNVISIEDAAGVDFKEDLTEEELGRHKYFDDDILELAEELEFFLRQRPQERTLDDMTESERTEIERLSNMRDQLVDIPSEARRVQELNRMIDERFGYYPDVEQAIARAEQAITDQLHEIENEYRRLANNLNDARKQEQYVDAVRTASRWEGELEMARNRVRSGTATPTDYSLVGNLLPSGEFTMVSESDLPAELREARSILRGYNRFYVDYRLLEEGLSITADRIALMDIVMGGAVIVLAEIVTGGMINFVLAGAATAGRALILTRAGRAIGRAGELLIRRYNRLLEETKTKLDEVFSRQPRTQRARPSEGTGGRGADRRPTTRPCSAAACR